MFSGDEFDMYLKMINKNKIKESIFCYWCSIYEEELMRIKKNGEMETLLNKVLISELSKKKHNQSIFLEIENNKLKILKEGTEINFLDISNYINEFKNEKNRYKKLFEYINKEDKDILFIGIKVKKN